MVQWNLDRHRDGKFVLHYIVWSLHDGPVLDGVAMGAPISWRINWAKSSLRPSSTVLHTSCSCRTCSDTMGQLLKEERKERSLQEEEGTKARKAIMVTHPEWSEWVLISTRVHGDTPFCVRSSNLHPTPPFSCVRKKKNHFLSPTPSFPNFFFFPELGLVTYFCGDKKDKQDFFFPFSVPSSSCTYLFLSPNKPLFAAIYLLRSTETPPWIIITSRRRRRR